MGRACRANGIIRNAYKILVAMPEGERYLRRSGHTWENNIKIGIGEIWKGRIGFMWLRIWTCGGLL
jgi:hypothetical protein